MAMTLQSEIATQADLDVMIERLLTPYLEESYPETFADVNWRSHWRRRLETWLNDDHVSVRILRGDPWQGFAVCRLIDWEGERHAEILEVYAEPSARRKGIGSTLIQDVMAWAAQHGAREMDIGVKVRNQPAVDFFASLGFAPQRLHLSRWI